MTYTLQFESSKGEKSIITNDLNMNQLRALAEHIEKGRISEFSKIEIISNKK